MTEVTQRPHRPAAGQDRSLWWDRPPCQARKQGLMVMIKAVTPMVVVRVAMCVATQAAASVELRQPASQSAEPSPTEAAASLVEDRRPSSQQRTARASARAVLALLSLDHPRRDCLKFDAQHTRNP